MRRTLDSLLVLSVFLAASPSFAQTFGQITVTNPQTGVAATEQANTAGVYVFPNCFPESTT